MDKVLFTGIGGVGMSKLALLYNDMGFKVIGSDIRHSKRIEALEKRGITVHIGHSKEHIDRNIQQLVYSSAVKEDNVELLEAKKYGISILKRGEALAKIVNQYKTIVVSGTHGKTTTTSLIGHILKHCGVEANVYVGGDDKEFDNFKKSAKYFVIESDESDGSFLLFDPDILVLTNIDKDHLNYYGGSFENLKKAFASLVAKSRMCVTSADDPNASDVSLHSLHRTFSTNSEKADLYARNIKYERNGTYFDAVGTSSAFKVFLPMFGDKNVSNSLAALLAVLPVGVDMEKASAALKDFSPPARRMEFKGEKDGVIVFDDHADHPTEVLATLSALKKHFPEKRLIAVYQPHRYSRIKALGREVSSPFWLADVVIVTEIYPAFENPIPGVNGRKVFDWVKESNPKKEVFFAPVKDDALAILKQILKKGDLVVLLGPGDVSELSSFLLKGL